MVTPRWPTQQQWEAKFTAALGAASEGVTTSPAIGDMVDVLSKVIEHQTGKPLGAFVGEQVAALVAKITREFMDGTLQISTELAKNIGQAIGSVASLIPIFAAAVEMGIGALEAAEAKQSARLQRMTQSALQHCRASYVRTLGTGIGGAITPADMFRPIFVAQEEGQRRIGRHDEYRYPVAATSLLCALCGPESPLGWNQHKRRIWTAPGGFGTAGGATVREELVHEHGAAGYEKMIKSVRQRSGKPTLGIPRDVRRRMAVIIEGIMASARPWTLEKIDPVGDQGRSLFPVLMDILLHEWRAKHWDLDLLRSLQNSQVGCITITNYQTGEVIGPVVDLSPGVKELVMGWKYTIEGASADLKKPSYLTKSARRSIASSLKFGVKRPGPLRTAKAVPRGGAGPILLAGAAVAALFMFARR